MTGLPNRALLIDRLQSALERSRRDDRTVAVLFCDLDGFKRVNDTGGHAAGDAVLLETARRLASAVRPTDTVARVGGDEFVILVEPWKRGSATNEAPSQARSEAVSDRDLAVQVASRITEAVSQPITVQGVDYVVTVSIGLSYSGGGEGLTGSELTADDFLQNADTAMYRAKGRGKDRLEVFEHTLRSELAERGRVERVLRRALRDHVDTQPVRGVSPSAASPVIYPAYQPVYDSRSGRLASFEVLARLTDADGSDIRPDVFVAVAEDVGLIQPLGKLMLHLACKQLVEWRAATPAAGDLTMAVNVSALQASHGSLGRDVTEALELHGLTPSDLILELTETAFLRASHSTLAALRELRSAGVGIAIDDFGTGYASLRYLATLPVSELKVDKSFTAGLPHDLTNRKIVHAVAGLAADLDLVCVVEGVETEEQRAALPPGVHLQGWLTGRPQCAGLIDLASLLRTSIPARRA